MEDYRDIKIDYVVHQHDMARVERMHRRTIIALMTVIVILSGIIFYLLMAFDYTDVTVDTQDGGNANYIGASGVINNAEGYCPKEDSQE